MTDLKHYGIRRRQEPLDGFFTGVAWFVALILLGLYLAGSMP